MTGFAGFILKWFLVVGFLGFAGWQVYSYILDKSQQRIPLTLGGDTFQVQVADTTETRVKGLSGSSQLKPDQGMLFDFQKDDKWGIWMKDMNYPIDIIWMDNGKQIVYMVKDAPPNSYPFTTFKPNDPARYVLELPAGTINKKRLKIGSKATFEINKIEEGEE